MNFLKIGYLVAIISLIQSNLYSQETYSQGLFETDKEFTDRVVYNFSPSIDSFEESNYTSAGIFEDGESISYERGFMFRFKTTRFKAKGDLAKGNCGWPDIIVKVISSKTRTSIHTKSIPIQTSNFAISEDMRTTSVSFGIPLLLASRKDMWKSIADEEILLEFYYKSTSIGRFKIKSLKSIVEDLKNDPMGVDLYPERY